MRKYANYRVAKKHVTLIFVVYTKSISKIPIHPKTITTAPLIHRDMCQAPPGGGLKPEYQTLTCCVFFYTYTPMIKFNL